MPRPFTRTVLPVCVPGATFTVTGGVEGRHLHLRAERGLGEGDRHLHREVPLAAAGEDRMGRDVHDDVEVTGRRAVEPGGAATLHPDPLAVVDARGDADLHRARPHLDPTTLAVLALVLDDAAATAARGAHLGERERTLVDGHRAGAVARGAPLGERARLRAGAVAHVAGRFRRDVHRRGDAVDGVEEVEVQLGLDVLAALGTDRALVATAPRAAATAAEEVAEDPAEVAQVAEVLDADVLVATGTTLTAGESTEATEATRTAGTAARRHHLADLVVLLALLGVAEHVVRGRDLLEAGLGRRRHRGWRRGGTASPACGRRA